MAQNLNYGDQVLHILNSDPIWAEFKDQNHDLFIMDTQKMGMIAGGESGIWFFFSLLIWHFNKFLPFF